jgi:primosomal protein N' (replication factor Y) (superfamily II helicase)
MAADFFLRIAVPAPLPKLFDYLPEPGKSLSDYQLGQRLKVQFGNQHLVGILLAIDHNSDVPAAKIRPISQQLDQKPVLGTVLRELCLWAADYYHHAIGEVIDTALPVLLRKGQAADFVTQAFWHANPAADTNELQRAKRQLALYEFLLSSGPQPQDAITDAGFTQSLLKALQEKNAVSRRDESMPPAALAAPRIAGENLQLNDEQAQCLQQITDDTGFTVFLLDGITGSGKTEVYLQAIARNIAAGQQALVLIPEIGLTPQTIARFEERFACPVASLHSGMNDRERLDAWLMAKQGIARIVVGTRSAIFTPMPELGLIIVDEEHDASFKQQEGFRYSARDLAVKLASQLNIPIVLGSATPSIDSLHNALSGKYRHLRLRQRAGNAQPAQMQLLDMRRSAQQQGLANDLIEDMRANLQRGEQSLVFINRRGFAPTLCCPDCGWIAECRRCDARYTLHRKPPHLHCHHCDHKLAVPAQCPNCFSQAIHPVGTGTEQLEDYLESLFGTDVVIRVDRDSTRLKDGFATVMEPVNAGKPCILVGTQMLAKGHHLPNVTLVIVVNADAGLFSADFRGLERTAQLLLQVTGRAGRGDKPGRAVIQTEFAEHPSLHLLCEENYHALALAIMQERQHTALPPYGFQALLRADAVNAAEAEHLLHLIQQDALRLQRELGLHVVAVVGPMAAPMQLRAGRFRFQLWFNSSQRKALHQLLKQLLPLIHQHRGFHKVRWSLDVDPLDSQ